MGERVKLTEEQKVQAAINGLIEDVRDRRVKPDWSWVGTMTALLGRLL